MRTARLGALLAASVLILAACGYRQPGAGAADTPSASATTSPSPTPEPTPLAIVGPTFQKGEVGLTYAPVTVQASGGTAPYAWTLANGALPGGLSLSPAGAISGTPTGWGTFTFTLQVTDTAAATASIAGRIDVVPQLSLRYVRTYPYNVQNGFPIVNVCTEARADHPCPSPDYRYAPFATVSGGAAPYTFTVWSGTLPPGTSLNGLSLVGTFAGWGAYDFTVQVKDAYGATAKIGIEFWLYRM